jgi:hypothetical protein
VLVGEPTMGRLNGYGETGRFLLPGHGLRVQYSRKYWRVLPDEDPDALIPDLLVEESFHDLQRDEDAALTAALRAPVRMRDAFSHKRTF